MPEQNSTAHDGGSRDKERYPTKGSRGLGRVTLSTSLMSTFDIHIYIRHVFMLPVLTKHERSLDSFSVYRPGHNWRHWLSVQSWRSWQQTSPSSWSKSKSPSCEVSERSFWWQWAPFCPSLSRERRPMAQIRRVWWALLLVCSWELLGWIPVMRWVDVRTRAAAFDTCKRLLCMHFLQL